MMPLPIFAPTRRKLLAMSLFSPIMSWLGKAGASEPRFPDIAEFRDLVIAALRQQPGIASATADPSNPAKIAVRIGEWNGSADVTNAFGYLNSYLDEDSDVIIGRFVSAVISIANTEANESNLVAVIRTPSSIEAMKANGDDVAYEPLIGDLVVLYMADMPDSLVTVTFNQFPGKSLADLRSIALGNLAKWLPKMTRERLGPYSMLYNVSGNEILVTGLILLDEFWESINPDFPGDVLIAIPRRDQLFIFGALDPKAPGEARRLIDATFQDNFNLLSEHIYQRREGKFEVFAK